MSLCQKLTQGCSPVKFPQHQKFEQNKDGGHYISFLREICTFIIEISSLSFLSESLLNYVHLIRCMIEYASFSLKICLEFKF